MKPNNRTTIIDIHGFKVEVPAQLRTPSQHHSLRTLIAQGEYDTAFRYLASFTGRGDRIGLHRLRTRGTDVLASKHTDNILTAFRALMNYTKTHVPSRKLPAGQSSPYIGVEIECFIPVNNPVRSLPDTGGDDTAECGQCEGTGRYEDEDGETSTCGGCSGDGYVPADSDGYDSAYSVLGELFREHGITRTCIKDDGSIRPDDGCVAFEITVLTRLDDPSNLRKVCELLGRMGTRVNKSCGLHVHLDMRHVAKTAAWDIGFRLESALPLLSQCVPESRRNNEYCKMTISRNDSDRYCAINMASYSDYKTIEVRMHSASTSFPKIMAWATLIKAIADSKNLEHRTSVYATFKGLREYVSISDALCAYFTQRIRLFSNQRVHASVADHDDADVKLTSTKLGVRICDARSAQFIRELNLPQTAHDLAAQAVGGDRV